MNPRDPLTLRIPRSVRETRRDPLDWWEGPREPDHCIIGFGGAMRPRRPRRSALRRLARRLWRWLAAATPFGSARRTLRGRP